MEHPPGEEKQDPRLRVMSLEPPLLTKGTKTHLPIAREATGHLRARISGRNVTNSKTKGPLPVQTCFPSSSSLLSLQVLDGP